VPPEVVESRADSAERTLEVGVVRDPDGLFLVLIEAPPP